MTFGRLPSLERRTRSTASTDTGDTRLGRAIATRVAEHPKESGVYPLRDAQEAFAARITLAKAAERSLDVQYYIWHADITGTLLFEALREAAARGVRVRLLLDDNNTAGLDPILAALNSHPNIEVRLFNPFAVRKPRVIGYLTDFSRLNRRMHNKSFTADNQATIVGGRNVGDEYFGATNGVLFTDLDVLAVGPVVNDVSDSFDRYWASGSSYSVDGLLPAVPPAGLAQLEAAAEEIRRSSAAVAYTNALRKSSIVSELVAGSVELEWARTQMLSDDPAKGLGLAPPETLVFFKLRETLGDASTRLELVSPYFVPTVSGVAWLTKQAKRGVAIQVLTNSLEATDVAVVHAGYAKRRKAVLEAGIILYELKRTAAKLVDRRARRRNLQNRLGSSGASLHAKTFAADGARVFVGSFNFDPRSAALNTEMGFVIQSAPLARPG